MDAVLRRVEREEAMEYLGELPNQELISATSSFWLGLLDGQMICVAGVVAQLLSDRAYLWMHHNDDLVYDHRLLFMRRSKRWIKDMLQSFPVIEGHTFADNESSKQWLCWLGAEFTQPAGPFIGFEIRRP